MNIRRIVIPLDAAAPHMEQPQALQRAFADACNLLAPVVRDPPAPGCVKPPPCFAPIAPGAPPPA